MRLIDEKILAVEQVAPYAPLELNNHRLKAGGFELRTESPDTRRLNDASRAQP